jgi:peroxiredoxin
MPAVKVGDVAPDFELAAVVGDKRQKFKLSDLRGQNVVLAFYVLNWTPT